MGLLRENVCRGPQAPSSSQRYRRCPGSGRRFICLDIAVGSQRSALAHPWNHGRPLARFIHYRASYGRDALERRISATGVERDRNLELILAPSRVKTPARDKIVWGSRRGRGSCGSTSRSNSEPPESKQTVSFRQTVECPS